MPAPTNISGATAIDLGALPFSITQDVFFGGTAYTVWYQFTAATTKIVGIWAFGVLAPGYQAICEVSTSSTGTPLYLGIVATNVPLQMPVTASTTYFLKITPVNPASSPALLTLTGEDAPDETVPDESIFINDDASGFPLAILSSTTGAVLTFVQPFPAGELAEKLPNGRVLVGDPDNTAVNLYETDLTLLATVPWTSATGAITSDRSHTFYLAKLNGTYVDHLVQTVSDTGTLGGTSWAIPNGHPSVRPYAVNLAATVLYYRTTTDAIGRWDLVNNVALADLVAPVGGNQIGFDILVLQDDTLIVVRATSVVHYSTVGAVLNTYTFDPLAFLNRLTYALDDPNSFWLWTQANGGTNTASFLKVKVSDGSILRTAGPVPQYEVGVYSPDETVTPAQRFGASESCPFWVNSLPAPPPETRVYPMRRLRRFTIPTDENKWIFLKRVEFELQRGVGLNDGQGSEATIMVRLSRDGGKTWTPEQWVSAGKIGEYLHRAIVRRLGRARAPVMEISMSDPVFWALQDAYLEANPGTS